jgi:predicted peptidase
LTLQPLGTVPGAPLGYIEYLPPGYGNTQVPLPLLLFFHGSGESGDGSAAQLPGLYDTGIPRVINMDQWPEDRPFVVLMAQHDSSTGVGCTTSQEIADFIKFATQHYTVDPARIYITGLSCGAIGGWDYLGDHVDQSVAAAVLIAGDGRDAFAKAGCRLGLVPIWAFHGGADPIVDPNGSIEPITQLQACTDPAPVDVRLNVYPGVGHAVWQPIYDGSLHLDIDIYSWLLSHTHQT